MDSAIYMHMQLTIHTLRDVHVHTKCDLNSLCHECTQSVYMYISSSRTDSLTLRSRCQNKVQYNGTVTTAQLMFIRVCIYQQFYRLQLENFDENNCRIHVYELES